MYEQVQAFDDGYAEARRWMISEQARLISRTQKGDLDAIEKEVADYTAELTARLTGPGRELMATEQFKSASFSQQMGFTRFRTSKAAADGYGSVSLVERAVLLQRNKRDGIISAPKQLKIDPERLEGSIGMVAQRLSEGDLDGAISAYAETQESIVKHSQIETVIASQRDGRETIEGMRITGDRDTCDFCKGLAGYWTVQLYSLRYFHASCTCRLVTRNL